MSTDALRIPTRTRTPDAAPGAQHAPPAVVTLGEALVANPPLVIAIGGAIVAANVLVMAIGAPALRKME